MTLAYIALAIIAVAIVSKLINLSSASSLSLQAKFKGLGNMYGKTLTEICNVVGKPSKQILHTDCTKTITWEAPKYAIGLEFDHNLICRKIAGEVKL